METICFLHSMVPTFESSANANGIKITNEIKVSEFSSLEEFLVLVI